jgi:predicted CXXCH cytochrome family protein
MSGRFEDAGHVVRLAGLFLGGLVLFFLLRAWLVPDDFGVYGHYRARAIADNRRREPVFAGQAACLDCHEAQAAERQAGRHAQVRCEACHGPLAAHAEGRTDDPPARPDGRTLCVTCHEAGTGRPAAFPQVVPADHAGDEVCTSCHRPHAPGLS